MKIRMKLKKHINVLLLAGKFFMFPNFSKSAIKSSYVRAFCIDI